MWEPPLCGDRLGRKTWPPFENRGAQAPPTFSMLAFFVRFVSNDQAMDPKIALTILPFALANSALPGTV